jgi:hypothetical protein
MGSYKVEWVPSKWLELAAGQLGLQVYSRPVSIERRANERRAENRGNDRRVAE